MEVRDGEIHASAVTPEEVGVEPAPLEALRAGTPQRNAEISREVLSGAPGPERSLTVLNAGAAIYAGARAESLEAGVRAAEEAIDSGAAREVLERYVERSKELAPRQ
jgi:anthranilate phosphoribosyltransferase